MTQALLWILLALAWAEEPRWAGVALDALPALGLGEAELTEGVSSWQAPVVGGGFVRLVWLPTEAAAQARFAQEAQRASTLQLPALPLAGADVAAGDGVGLVVARSRNVVLVVRSLEDRAGAVAAGLLGALEAEPAGLPAPGTRDPYGRRAEDLQPAGD